MLSRRVTLRDIAKTAKVHVTTVSRALRGDPSIPEKTRQKIQKIAEKLGYAPDPMVSALTVYRSKIRAAHYQATIIWATNNFTREGWTGTKTYNLYYKGCQERASQLGFKLEEFWLREPGLSWSRASKILAARNISGLILSPQPRSKMRVRLDWQKFSAVSMGYSIAWPKLHVITNDQYNSMIAVVRHMWRRGYRRIGLVLGRRDDTRVNHGWSAGFLACQQFWSQERHIPILDDIGYEEHVPMKEARMKEWISHYQPDAIISHPLTIRRLHKFGLRIPQDIGFACYTLQDAPTLPDIAFSGIDENAKLTGSTAVDMLIAMLHRGERGMPAVAQRISIEGSWREGNTLRPSAKSERG